MELNKQNLASINDAAVTKPASHIFNLPEKVLQFGTGVLLRGLPDYFIDKANKQQIFNGRIVVIKSTGNGGSDEFSKQDGLYTHIIKGYKGETLIEENSINASISRVLAAKTEWQEILKCAANKEMNIIISNTTEVGIVFDENDSIHNNPPASFPGKLLALLYERYKIFGGTAESGYTIIPTELITDNATKLKAIVLQLAKKLQLESAFIEWIASANDFCNSLVDRIVPGKPSPTMLSAFKKTAGYTDEISIMSEVYSLWAIETSNPVSIERLSFTKTDSGVVIAPNIDKFRELKLRLLNGTHTFSCGLAFLVGFETVKEAMADTYMGKFVHNLMMYELAPGIVNTSITESESTEFARAVIDRFRNPHIEHKWISITLNYTDKMKMRNVPLLLKYYEQHQTVPTLMALGFAAYILFMKAVKEEGGKYYGEYKGQLYLIQDVAAAKYYQWWQEDNHAKVVHQSLRNKDFWGTDLTHYNEFEITVLEYVDQLIKGEAKKILTDLFE
jgi:tagaturonate reductase